MNRIPIKIFLMAVVVAGCSSHPPQEIANATETVAAEQATEEQDPGFAALPATQTALADGTPGQQDKELAFPAAAHPAQVPRLKYEALRVLPEAQSRALQFYLGSQAFDYIEDGEVFVSGPIASGKASTPTPTGKFSVLSKDKNKESSRYTNEVGTQAWMPYSLQFYGNYFVHEGWLPGRPASHGCIRLDHYHAKLLFERMRIGDRVTVSNQKSQPRQQPAVPQQTW